MRLNLYRPKRLSKYTIYYLIFVVGGTFLPHVSKANPLFQLKLGGGNWFASIDGELGSSTTPITTSELGVNDDPQEFYYLEIEHDFPVLPYVRLEKLNYGHIATQTVPREFTLDTVTFPETSTIRTDINLDYTEISFYYPVLSSWLSIDLGLSGRQYDGFINLSIFQPVTTDGDTPDTAGDSTDPADGDTTGDDTTDVGTGDDASTDGEPTDTATSEQIDLSGTIPLGLLNANLDLPFSNWYLAFSVNHVGFNGNTFTDWETKLGYKSKGTLVKYQIELGYRQLKISADDLDNFTSEITIDGLYANVGLVF